MELCRSGRSRSSRWLNSFCAALRHNRIPVLEWLHEHHFREEPLTDPQDIVAGAAGRGQLAVLKWLRDPERGDVYPWDNDTTRFAADHEQWDVLKWAVAEADPPCDWSETTEAMARAHFGDAEVDSWNAPAALNRAQAMESDYDDD